MNEIELKRLVQTIQEVNQSLKEIAVTLSGSTDEFTRKTTAAARQARVDWMGSFPKEELNRAMTTYVTMNVGMFDRMTTTIKDKWNDVARAANKIGEGITNAIGVNPVKNFTAGMQTAMSGGSASQMIQQFMTGIPGGGLIALMLYGREQQLKFGALGQQAAQEFKQVGSVGREVAGQLAGDIKRLSVSSMAAEGDIQAVAKTFASMGISAASSQARIKDWDTGVRGLASTSVNAALQLDKMYQLGTGTAAKQIAELMLNTNAGLEGTLKLYRDISGAARDSGMSQQLFVGSVMQATSALRTQHVDAKSVANTMRAMQEGFQAQGLTKETAGAMAARGIGAVASGVAGMNEGMLAHIGEKVSARVGSNLKGVEALVEMQRGFRGQPGSDRTFALTLMEVLRESRNISGGNVRTQEFALQKLGFSVEAAQALISLQGTGKSEEQLMKDIKASSKDLTKAFTDEALKTNAFTRIMRALQSTIADLGVNLLTVLIGGFRTLEVIGKLGLAVMLNPMADREKLGDLASGLLLKTGAITDAALGRASANVGKILKLSGSALDTAVGGAFTQTNAFDAEFKKVISGPGAGDVAANAGSAAIKGMFPMISSAAEGTASAYQVIKGVVTSATGQKILAEVHLQLSGQDSKVE